MLNRLNHPANLGGLFVDYRVPKSTKPQGPDGPTVAFPFSIFTSNLCDLKLAHDLSFVSTDS